MIGDFEIMEDPMEKSMDSSLETGDLIGDYKD